MPEEFGVSQSGEKVACGAGEAAVGQAVRRNVKLTFLCRTGILKKERSPRLPGVPARMASALALFGTKPQAPSCGSAKREVCHNGYVIL